MPKRTIPLTVKEIKKLPDGRHAVGGVPNLYIDKKNGLISFWFLRDQKNPKNTVYYSHGLTLEQVREQARRDLELKRLGDDPKANQKALIQAQEQEKEANRLKELEATATLEKVTLAWFKKQAIEGKWKNSPKGEIREFSRIKKHVFPTFKSKPISTISAQDMAELFNRLYLERYGTTTKILTTLRSIFSWARVSKQFGQVPMPFDDDFAELTKTARGNKQEVNNRASLPFNEIPTFMEALLEKGDTVSLAIVFSILTASRGQPIRLATWDEIDLEKGTWILSREHDKMKRPEPSLRTVFLSKQAIDFLNRLPSKQDHGLLFPPRLARPLKPMDENSIGKHIRDMHKLKKMLDGIGWVDPKILDDNDEPKVITQHGTARSGFKTWARDDVSGNFKKYDAIAVELCLLHLPQDIYGRAYDRHLMETQRRQIMQDWADYCLKNINFNDYLERL